jgi:hypothetical protein
MRKRRLLILAACSLLWTAFAQDNTAPAPFAGTWHGSFKGTVFCVLKINTLYEMNGRATATIISGTLSPGKISVNDDGDLTEAEPSAPDAAAPMLHARIDGKTLSFKWKETGEDEAVKLELRLTGDNQAEMRSVGETRIKPIHLRRATDQHEAAEPRP